MSRPASVPEGESPSPSEETGWDLARSYRWLIAALVLVAVVGLIGWFRGGSEPESANGRLRSCTEVDSNAEDLAVSTRIEIRTGEDGSTELSRTIEAVVPNGWWELEALRSPDPGPTDVHAAQLCLFADIFDDGQVSFKAGESSTVVSSTVEGSIYLLATRECGGGHVDGKIDGLHLRIFSAESCYDTLPLWNAKTVEHEIRIQSVDPTSLRVWPNPTSDKKDGVSWTWDGSQADRQVAIAHRLTRVESFSSRLRASVLEFGTEDLRASIHLGAAPNVLATIALVLLPMMAATATGHQPARWYGLLLAAGVAWGALVIRLDLPKAETDNVIVTALGPVAALAVSGALLTIGSGGWRAWTSRGLAAVATSLVVAATLVGLAVTRDDSSIVDKLDRGPAILLGAATLLATIGLLNTCQLFVVSAIPRPTEPMRAIVVAAGLVVALSVAHATGYLLGWAQVASKLAFGTATATAPSWLIGLTPALIVAVVASQLRGSRAAEGQMTLALSVLLGSTWAVVASPGTVMIAGVVLPLGLLGMTAVFVAIIARSETPNREPSAILAKDLGTSDQTVALFNRGPSKSLRTNLAVAVRAACYLSLPAIAYFSWGLVDELPNRTSGTAALGLSISLVVRWVSWLAAGAVYCIAQSHLPGRLGPIKAAALSTAWFVPAVAIELLEGWQGVVNDRSWLFPGFELVLFLTALSVWYDYRTIASESATPWTHLRAAYRIDRARDILKVVGPAAVASLAVVDQLANGSAADIVRQVAENAPDIIPDPE